MNSQSQQAVAPKNIWLVVTCAALIVTLSMGARQAFGLFLRPMSLELGISREAFGLALALQNLLWGLAQPFIGAVADRWGAGRVVAFGALLYAGGLLLAAEVSQAFGLHLSLGVLVGLALSATTFVVVLGAVGRAVPDHQRSLAFGITTAGGSLGQFLVVPGAQAMLGEMGWRLTFMALAALIAVAVVLAIGVAGKPRHTATSGQSLGLVAALKEAAGHSDFWLLNASFFVCGFQLAFIGTHFPAYLADKGLAPGVGAMSLAFVGLFNIFGSYLFGAWGGRWRKSYLLAAIYSSRSVVIALFLILPLTDISALVFASVMGFIWLGTVPLTSGIVGQVFGMQYMSTLYGIVFMCHQIGSFFGAWMAGRVYDSTGSYDTAWGVSIALGLVAALTCLPVRGRPVGRLAALA